MQQTPPKSFQTISHHNTMKTTTTSTSSSRGLAARAPALLALVCALAVPTASLARTVSVAAIRDGAATAAFGDPDGAAYTLAWGYGPADGGASTNAWAHFETLGTVAADAVTTSVTLPAGWGDTVTHLRFFLLEPEIPAAATRVEYLESSGTQWINSGVNLCSNDTVVAEYGFPDPVGSGSKDLFGVYKGGMTARFIYSSGKLVFHKATGTSGATSTGTDAAVTPGTRQVVTMSLATGATSTIVSASGETLYSGVLGGTISQNATAPLSLFALTVNGSPSSSYACTAKLYSFQIYDENNALRLDLVPCTVNGTPAMFDRVTQGYLTNVGTGDFATGATMATPLLVAASSATASTADYGEPDAYLDYVEATGTQMVNTECLLDPNSVVVAEYEYPDPIAKHNNYLFGVYRCGMTAGYFYSNRGSYPLRFQKANAASSAETTEAGINATPGARQTVTMKLASGVSSSIVSASGETLYSGTLSGTISQNSTAPLVILGLNNQGNLDSNYACSAKIYSFRIYDGEGNIARHFLPCLKGSVAGLYDKVTGRIFRSATATALVAGPVLPRPAELVEWVQSDGASGDRQLYIDTGIPAKAGTGMTAELLWPVKPSVASTVCGAMADSTHHFTLYTSAGTHQIGYANYSAFRIDTGDTSGVFSRKRYRVTSSLAASAQNLLVEYLDGTGTTGSRSFNDANAIDAGHSLYLFARNDAGTPNQLAKVRLYALVLTNELGVVRDFVPCVADNGRAGLYDRFSERVFFPQAAVAGAAADFDFASEVGAVTNALVSAAAPAARLSYVESNGASDFVDLGVIGRDGTKMVAEMEWVTLDSPATFCGAAASSSSLFTTYRINADQQRMGYANGSRTIDNGTISPVAGTRYRVTTTLDDGAQSLLVEKKVDGVWTRSGSTDRTDAGLMDTGFPLTLFARNLAGVPDEFAAARVYSLKLWQKNGNGEYELVRDLVPAKGAEGGAALWDRVGNRFYRNSGDRYGLSAGSESQWIDGFYLRFW